MSEAHPLRPLRLVAEFTQADLAKHARISTREVSAIERREYRPRMPTRRALLRALGAPFWTHRDIFGPLRFDRG